MTEELIPRYVVAPNGTIYIGLENYVGPENPFGREHQIYSVWESYAHYEALKDAGFSAKDILRVREAFLASWFLDNRFGIDPEMPPDIAVFVCTVDTAMERFGKIVQTVVDSISTIGGDDGFYDYFPNTFSMLEQIAYNLTEAPNALGDVEKKAIKDQLALTRVVAVCMRYTEPEDWPLINASVADHQMVEAWRRRGWVVSVENSILFLRNQFTAKFWDAMRLPVVQELTA